MIFGGGNIDIFFSGMAKSQEALKGISINAGKIGS